MSGFVSSLSRVPLILSFQSLQLAPESGHSKWHDDVYIHAGPFLPMLSHFGMAHIPDKNRTQTNVYTVASFVESSGKIKRFWKIHKATGEMKPPTPRNEKRMEQLPENVSSKHSKPQVYQRI